MKKVFIFIFCLLAFNANAKETTFDKTLFDKAQSEGKIVVVSSWVKYCTSCASQMKVLDKAKNDFNNIEYFKFEDNPKILAAAIAMIIGILSKNIIATIFTGLASYWFLIFVV